MENGGLYVLSCLNQRVDFLRLVKKFSSFQSAVNPNFTDEGMRENVAELAEVKGYIFGSITLLSIRRHAKVSYSEVTT